MNGHWQWVHQSLKPDSIPKTVSSQICGRLGRLDRSELRAIEFISLLDSPIAVSELAEMMRVSITEILETLGSLDRLKLVTLSGTLDRPVTALTHDWIGHATQVRMASQPARKRKMHERIASVLEEKHLRSNKGLLAQTVVNHYLASGNAAKASRYLWSAVSHLGSRQAYKHAAALIERAATCGALASSDWPSMKKTVDVVYLAGQFQKCLAFCESFLKIPELENEQRAFLLSLVAQIHINKGNMVEGIEVLKGALNCLTDRPGSDLLLELEAQWLYSMTRIGRLQEVSRVAKRFLEHREKYTVLGDRFYHAVCSFLFASGRLKEAIEWQTLSIQSAFEQKKYISSGGRIANLGIMYSEMGRLAVAEKTAQYTLNLADEIGNSELAVFAKGALCVTQRKLGRHKQAISQLNELVVLNEASNQNQHIDVEAHIEIAKNLNYQIQAEKALSFIVKARQLCNDNPVFSSLVDSSLALGWTWVLLGRSDRALEAISDLDPKKLGREKGRYHLLRSRIHQELGELDQAWQSAARAARAFPEHMTYYRARARLTQAEVRLAQNLPEEALEFVSQALAAARMEFYFPLLVKGHTLYARGLLLSGNYAAARVQALRALQLARLVDRPALKAEVYQVLAQSEVAVGDQEKGLRSYSRALQILKERSLHLSFEYRESFTKRFIAPIETEREKTMGDSDSPAPKYLIHLRGILGSLKETGNPHELGEHVLTAVTHSLPDTSANLFLRQSWSGRFQLVASKGKCLRTGRHLLPKPDAEEGEFISQKLLSEIVEGQHASPIYLYSGSHVLGLLYLESGPRHISEVDMDFLLCIATILETKIQENLRLPPEQIEGTSKLDPHPQFRIIGQHPSITTLLEYIRLVAPTEATVLITGESGTGKELVARAVHDLSLRAGRKFIPINCGALPSDLIESELFGHMQGSFTGAVRDKRGLFEAASGGTLFLDEISTLAFELQARLLRVLERKEIRRIGETKHRSADVRIVAATNQPLDQLVEKGEFREDLYHRLNVYLLQVPPLRDRTSDIPVLINHFLQDWNRRTGKQKGISPEVIGLLSHYHFPGNVRELENIITSSFQLSGGVIEADVVTPRISGRRKSPQSQRGSKAEAIYEDLVSGRKEFWSDVRDSFLNRDLTRDDLRKIISLGLTACRGSYRKLLEHLRLPQDDYKKFLTFLTHHDCKLDFRPFRKQQKVEV